MTWNGMKWNEMEWMSALLFLSFKWLHVPCVSREQRRISNASGGEDQLTGKAESFESYRWWKKSTAPVDDSKSRICYSIVHVSTGAGFPPSTVLTQKIWLFHPLKLDFSPHMYPYATGNRVPHALEITSPEQLKKGPLFWLYKWLNPTMLNADYCNDEWDMDYCPLGVLGAFCGGHGIWNSIGLYS